MNCTRVYVEGNVTAKGTVNGGTGQLLLVQLGPQALFVTATVDATLIAPNARIEVEPGHRVVGALIANNVEMHQDAELVAAPFPAAWVE